MGRKNPEHSKKMKGRLNIGPSKSVFQLDKENNKIINRFPSIAEATRQTAICSTSIVNTINGRAKSAGGYKWKRGSEK